MVGQRSYRTFFSSQSAQFQRVALTEPSIVSTCGFSVGAFWYIAITIERSEAAPSPQSFNYCYETVIGAQRRVLRLFWRLGIEVFIACDEKQQSGIERFIFSMAAGRKTLLEKMACRRYNRGRNRGRCHHETKETTQDSASSCVYAGRSDVRQDGEGRARQSSDARANRSARRARVSRCQP